MSTQEQKLTAIADAIREKNGTTEPIPAGDFAARIRAIQGGGGDVSLESISITAPPSKVNYKTGELFDPTGMSVWAEFSNGYGLYVNHADLTFTPAGPLEEGTESVTVRFSWGGESAETTQAVSVKNVRIYGVEWDGSANMKLARTDDAAGFVDPVPYVAGATEYGSPFDDIMPWAGMVRVTDAKAGELVAIPKYWIKVSHFPFKVWISNTPVDGFQVSPAHRDREDGKGERDVVYIGRYECDSSYKSRSNQRPKVSAPLATFRTGIHSLGAEYWQGDFALQLTWLFLYLVEFADWDGNKAVGCGVSISGISNTGGTDSMPYHTGSASKSSGTDAVQYRNIENPWGNVFEWRDGIVFSDTSICTYNNPANFSNSYNAKGGKVRSNKRIAAASGYTSVWGYDTEDESFIYPSEVKSINSGYIAYCSYEPGVKCLCVGGSFRNGKSLSSPFCLMGSNGPTNSSDNIGSRLMMLPDPEEEVS